MLKLFQRKCKSPDDTQLREALEQWRGALAKFDSANNDEVRFMALQVEAARQRYVYLLNKQREEEVTRM